jgi:predicted Zn-ribbon and HTH transcriptional regulator
MTEDSVAEMHCPDCGATFPRHDVATPAKGTLACPECHSTDIEDVRV